MSLDRRVMTIHVDEIAASTVSHYVRNHFGSDWLVDTVTVVPHETLAADATNYHSAALKDGSTSIATVDTSSTAFTAGTARSLTVSDRIVNDGDVLEWDLTPAGSGGAGHYTVIISGILVAS